MSESSQITVHAIADQLGITLSSRNIVALLAQEAEYRVEQIITPAAILHKKTHTPKLTVQHINMVLASQSTPLLLGYSSTSSYKTEIISDDTDELCIVNDPVIQLSDAAKHIARPAPRPVPFNFQWMMVDGIPIERRNARLRQTPTSINKTDRFGPSENLRAFSESSDQQICNKDVISPDLQQYFEHAVGVFDTIEDAQFYRKWRTENSEIEGNENENDGKHVQTSTSTMYSSDPAQLSIFESLSSDAGIQPLFPLFLQFLSAKLMTDLNNNAVIERVCMYITYLINNPSLPVPLFAHSILRIAMTIVLRFDSGTDISADIALRKKGAEIIDMLCHRCISGFPNIRTVIVNSMIQILFSTNSTLAAHFGALQTIQQLGTDLVLLLAPHLSSYIVSLKREIAIGNENQIEFLRYLLTQLEEMMKIVIEANLQPLIKYQNVVAEIETLVTKL